MMRPIGAALAALLDPGLLAMVAGALVLGAGYAVLSRRLTSREATVAATLAAFSAAGRVLFAAMPSVQPSTVLIICSGYVLGPGAGFLVGATTAFASNFFLGHGPWTVWQMVGWGLSGVAGGLAGRAAGRLHVRRDTVVIVPLSIAAGFAFGWLMDAWHWLSFVYPHTAASLAATLATSLWFDTMHAAGNAVFALVLAPRVVRILRRFKARMTFSRAPAVSALRRVNADA